MSISTRNTKTLTDLLKIPENRVCFDCDTKGIYNRLSFITKLVKLSNFPKMLTVICLIVEPRWCSLSFGVFICIRCAGNHRKYFGKVKSIDLGMFCRSVIGVNPVLR